MSERKPETQPDQANWLDRAIFALAPEYGARRISARRAFFVASKMQERFARIEAAEKNETRGDRWLASRLSPDSQLEQDLGGTRDNSREIYQNDAMGGVVDGKVNHVIGTGHTPQARVSGVDNADAINEQIESVYRDWAPRADRAGRRSLWMLSRLAERHNEFDGESFTVLSDVGRADKPIPLAVQVIDPERVETPAELSGDPYVRMGIRENAAGDILGYYVRRSHPGDTKRVDLAYEFVPADRMLHVFEPWFAEQSRGLPWMTRALNRARDAKDLDEAHILKAQIEACYAGFVKPSMVSGYMSATAAATGTAANGRRVQDITPGTLAHLDPGEDIVFSSPQSPGNGFAPFMEWNYRRVAAALNWPYEMVVKNWGSLSFSAGRLVLTDAKKSTQVGQKIMCEMWLCRVWARMVEEAVIVGAVDIDPRDYLANPLAYQRHVWIPPRWDYALNPGEDVKADIDEIGANLQTLEDALGKRGYDLEEFVARRKREKEILEAAGLTVVQEQDAQQPQASGEEPEGEPSETEDEQEAPA